MLGIENLKRGVLGVVRFGNELAEGLADGKLNMGEKFNLADNALDILWIVQNSKAIVDEFKDLDSEERAELIDAVATELSLPNENTEAKIERSLVFAGHIHSFIVDFSDLDAPV